MPAGLRSAAATCANRQAGLDQTHRADRIKDAAGRTRSGRLAVGAASTRHSVRTKGQRDAVDDSHEQHMRRSKQDVGSVPWISRGLDRSSMVVHVITRSASN